MIKKNKNTKKKRKVWGALALGMLLLSGGAFAMPFNNSNQVNSLSFKTIKENPSDFLKINNLEVKNDFDYIEEMNKEFTNNSKSKGSKFFSEKNQNENEFNSTNKDAEALLLRAIEDENYTEWKSALKELKGYPENVGVISEDDFKILVKIHKDRKDL